MDMTQLLQPNTTYSSQSEVTKTIPTSVMMNQSCNLPDSTTESPTASQVDTLLLPNPNELQQLTTSCHSNQLLVQGKDNIGIDSDGLEEFRNFISDVSVPVMVDSTQPTNTVVDFPQFGGTGGTESVNNYQQYVTNNQNNQQQVTQNTISQIIQPEIYKDQQKVPQQMIGTIDSCISTIIPDFSNYPANCTCNFIDKIVAVEQIWVCDKQMYFLPQIGIVVIGNREYAGIFHDQKKGYIAFGEVIEKMMPQYEADLISFLQRSVDLDQYTLTPQEEGYLEQRQCIPDLCKYKCAVSLNMLRQMAQFIVMYEGDKPGFDSHLRMVANGDYYRKVFQRHVRCGSCGGVILYSQEPEEYVLLKTDENEGKNDTKCFSVGFIHVGGLKFVAFKTDNRLYISIKELCQKQILRLQVLQARLGALRQRPRLAPSVLNNYLNTPEYDVKNTMWIDIATLRCVCCMGKCSLGCNVQVYGCFARVIFKEHIVTNIYGVDDHELESAVYTMDPKTFEVIMKKTSMKPKQPKPPQTPDKPNTKTNLKSFELSSKQAVGYESPEKLNDSAFMYQKSVEEDLPEHDSSFIRKKCRPKSSLKNASKSKKSNEEEEIFIFEDKDSAIDFLTKGKFENKEEIKSIKEESSKKKNANKELYIPGKKPTFRVKPAEKPYQYNDSKKEDHDKADKPDLSKIKIKMENNRYVLTLSNTKPKGSKGKKESKVDTKSAKKSNRNTRTKSGKNQKYEDHDLEKPAEDGEETRNAVNHLVEEVVTPQESVVTENCEIKATSANHAMEICDTDTTISNQTTENFEIGSPVSNYVSENSELRTPVSDHTITPRTESRILSGIDLDGSISNVFDTPTQGNVVVEMVDNNENEPFADSTSPLSQLYHHYEQFERFSSLRREATPETVTVEGSQPILHSTPDVLSEFQSQSVSLSEKQGNIADETPCSDKVLAVESSLQIRNEIEMPIDVSKGDISIQKEKYLYPETALDDLNFTKSKPIELHGNDTNWSEQYDQQNEDIRTNNSGITQFDTSPRKNGLRFKVCSEENILRKSLSPDTYRESSKSTHSDQRQKRSKTLSPPKNRKPAPDSPFTSKNIKGFMLNSPVFKKSGEIDRSHAKVQKLTELEDKPLDLLATLAQVITDESESQLDDEDGPDDQEDSSDTENVGNEKDNVEPIYDHACNSSEVETCAISDESSNVDKISLNRDCENILNRVDQNESNEKILQLISDVQNCLSIDPYKDKHTGHWKVKIQLKPYAKKAFPDLFSDYVDKKKRNQFLALLGKLHLTKLWNNVPFDNSDEALVNKDTKTSKKSNRNQRSGKKSKDQKSNPKSLKKSSSKSSKKSSSQKPRKKASHHKPKKKEKEKKNVTEPSHSSKMSETLSHDILKSRKRGHASSIEHTKTKKRRSR